MKYSYVLYDWKQGGCEEEYEAALKVFGLVMTPDPFEDGGDNYAYFITEKKPTKAQLNQLMIKEHGRELLEELEIL